MQFERGILIPKQLLSLRKSLAYLDLPLTNAMLISYQDFLSIKDNLTEEIQLLDSIAYLLETQYEYVLSK
jgi:hypothetical protein